MTDNTEQNTKLREEESSIKRIQLRTSAVNVAYKLVPLPSGCSNCWGDLGEGCSEECRRSSHEHDKKIKEAVDLILALFADQLSEICNEVIGKLEWDTAIRRKPGREYRNLLKAEQRKKLNHLIEGYKV